MVVRFVITFNLALAVPLAVLFVSELWIAWCRRSLRRLLSAQTLFGLCVLTELVLVFLIPVLTLVAVAEAVSAPAPGGTLMVVEIGNLVWCRSLLGHASPTVSLAWGSRAPGLPLRERLPGSLLLVEGHGPAWRSDLKDKGVVRGKPVKSRNLRRPARTSHCRISEVLASPE